MQLKQLARVVVRYNPWQANGRSAREFLSRCQSPTAIASNPDCKVGIALLGRLFGNIFCAAAELC